MLSSEIKSQVLAMMYGDVFVDVNENSGKARLDIYHSEPQLELLMMKKQVLESITGITTHLSEKNDPRILKNGKTRKGYRLQTNFSRYFYKLKKAPFKYVARQLVKPKALAILWSDDGTLCIHNKRYFSSALLCTDSFEIWQVEELRKSWNDAYGWCPVLVEYACRGKTYPRLRLVKAHAEALADIVTEHTVEALKYKLLPYKTLESK